MWAGGGEWRGLEKTNPGTFKSLVSHLSRDYKMWGLNVSCCLKVIQISITRNKIMNTNGQLSWQSTSELALQSHPIYLNR